MSQAGRLFGSFRTGRPGHPSTCTRHATKGLRLADGSVVKLEAIKVANRLMTSRAAVERFLARQQGGQVTSTSSPPRSPARRTKASAAADAELASLGVR